MHLTLAQTRDPDAIKWTRTSLLDWTQWKKIFRWNLFLAVLHQRSNVGDRRILGIAKKGEPCPSLLLIFSLACGMRDLFFLQIMGQWEIGNYPRKKNQALKRKAHLWGFFEFLNSWAKWAAVSTRKSPRFNDSVATMETCILFKECQEAASNSQNYVHSDKNGRRQ